MLIKSKELREGERAAIAGKDGIALESPFTAVNPKARVAAYTHTTY